MKLPAAGLLIAVALAAQVAEQANENYRTREQRERLARNFSGPDRDRRQKPRELVEAIGIRPGMTVADLGTGSGYMLPYLSRAVGPAGRVIAEDIFEDMLEKAREKAAGENLENVSFVLGGEKNARLPRAAVDLVLALDTYHHFNYPAEMLASIGRALRNAGRLVVVDYYKAAYRDPAHVRLERDDAIEEIEANGFRLVEKRDHLPGSQYIAVFEKR